MKKLVLFIVFAVLVFGGCSKKAEEPGEKEEIEEMQEEPKEDLTGKDINPLTGLYIDETAAHRRPVAVTINNLHKALPQSGIAQADLYYETLAEGEITRIVALFQDFDAEKIGPVRSARDYFTYFALDNDAVYIHHGGSETGYAAIANRDVDDIDGMVDAAFWRDKERVNQPGMYEHSSYTNAENIFASWEKKGYREDVKEGLRGMFSFLEEDTDLAGDKTALDVSLPYSSYQVSQFQYLPEEKLYERYQTGEPQIDDQTGETLKVKNVIIQYANMRVIDSAGRRDIDLVGSGSGVYITNGKAVDITWSKEKYNTPTKWFDSEGKELKLNKGKTWICVYPNGGAEITFVQGEADGE